MISLKQKSILIYIISLYDYLNNLLLNIYITKYNGKKILYYAKFYQRNSKYIKLVKS